MNEKMGPLVIVIVGKETRGNGWRVCRVLCIYELGCIINFSGVR